MLTKKQYKMLWSLWKDNTIEEEKRCYRCRERETCPAFDTGVLYPCPYFEEEINRGTKK